MTEQTQQNTTTTEAANLFVDIRVAHTIGGGSQHTRTQVEVSTNAPVQDPILASVISKVLSREVLIPSNASKISESIGEILKGYIGKCSVSVPQARTLHFELDEGVARQPDAVYLQPE
ncbi:hypothetical protein E2C01_020201 [Portunus trituberculatus]|uniref:Uncharacterized protein n=1 Tax=Portunus trituberculatus TaxID=210409 RepID=A0A5B7DZI7_PORTR|nr:hypothetical protein [Portunus trituberculatus]